MTDEQQTVTVEDLNGEEYEVPAGLDGQNPVSPNNPPLKAVSEEERDRAVEARKREVEFAKDVADAADAGEGAASTNKEDNNPGETVRNSDDKPKQRGTNLPPKK